MKWIGLAAGLLVLGAVFAVVSGEDEPEAGADGDGEAAELCRCLTEPGNSAYMQANEGACDTLFDLRLGVTDWESAPIASYKSEWAEMERECNQQRLEEALVAAPELAPQPIEVVDLEEVAEERLGMHPTARGARVLRPVGVVEEPPSTYPVGWDMQQEDPQCREDCDMRIRVVITKDGTRFQNFEILPGENSDSMVFNHETDSHGECTGEKSGRGILCAAINFSCGDSCYQDLVHVRVKGETLEIHRNEGCMGGSDDCLSSDVLAQFPLGPGATVIPAVIQRKPEVVEGPKPTHEVFNTAGDVKEPWLNLREGPSGKRAIVGQLPDGTGLIWIAASRGRWAQVKVADGPYAGRTGFLNTKWIREK